MSKNKNVILYGLLALIVVGAIYFIPMFSNDPFEKIKTEILQTNKTLPKMVDEETRLELVQFVDKKIETYYTLVKITKEEVDVEKRRVKFKTVCKVDNKIVTDGEAELYVPIEFKKIMI